MIKITVLQGNQQRIRVAEEVRRLESEIISDCKFVASLGDFESIWTSYVILRAARPSYVSANVCNSLLLTLEAIATANQEPHLVGFIPDDLLAALAKPPPLLCADTAEEREKIRQACHERMFKLFADMQGFGLWPNLRGLAALARSAVRHFGGQRSDLFDNSHDASRWSVWKWLDYMRSKNVVPQVVTYNGLIRACADHPVVDIACADALLNEMKTNNHLSPDAVSYETIMFVCFAGKEIERAFALLHEMRMIGVPFSKELYARVLHICAFYKAKERALAVIDLMRGPIKRILPYALGDILCGLLPFPDLQAEAYKAFQRVHTHIKPSFETLLYIIYSQNSNFDLVLEAFSELCARFPHAITAPTVIRVACSAALSGDLDRTLLLLHNHMPLLKDQPRRSVDHLPFVACSKTMNVEAAKGLYASLEHSVSATAIDPKVYGKMVLIGAKSGNKEFVGALDKLLSLQDVSEEVGDLLASLVAHATTAPLHGDLVNELIQQIEAFMKEHVAEEGVLDALIRAYLPAHSSHSLALLREISGETDIPDRLSHEILAKLVKLAPNNELRWLAELAEVMQWNPALHSALIHAYVHMGDPKKAFSVFNGFMRRKVLPEPAHLTTLFSAGTEDERDLLVVQLSELTHSGTFFSEPHCFILLKFCFDCEKYDVAEELLDLFDRQRVILDAVHLDILEELLANAKLDSFEKGVDKVILEVLVRVLARLARMRGNSTRLMKVAELF